jgi:hypothetical protein
MEVQCRLFPLHKPSGHTLSYHAVKVQQTRRPYQLPPQSNNFPGTQSSVRSCSRHKSVAMHSSAAQQSITISSLQESFHCNVLQPASAPDTHTALILLSDIFGSDTNDTLNASQVHVIFTAVYSYSSLLQGRSFE